MSQNLLIACHCESLHGSVKIIGKEFDTIQYIDTNEGLHESVEKCKKSENQYIEWHKIPNSSINFIYIASCPLYGDLYEGRMYEDTTAMWRSLDKHGWNVLKANGKIIIPINKHINPDNKLKNILKKLMPLWNCKIVYSIPFYLENYDAEKYIIFKKETENIKGGRGRITRKKQKIFKQKRL